MLFILLSCNAMEKTNAHKTAKQILGNSDFQAMSYGGYRSASRKVQPSVAQIKEDLKILAAMNLKVIRTYNVHLPEARNIVRAIHELSSEDSNFEMYVMLGAWIDCKNAWTGLEPDHTQESERNATEIKLAVDLAKQYPEIIKIIAVGNEAMVKWAAAYYVQPAVILKWVNYLQDLKKNGELSKDLWITSSDNFASWGGGSEEYHTEDLVKLMNAVDYLSIHTYPMHDTHYNPAFWGVKKTESGESKEKQIEKAMLRSLGYAKSQYKAVKQYMQRIGITKPVHIGETGWASYSNELYGNAGSKAVDEYKAGIYYQMMRKWTEENQISCFFFEAFDEPWKDAENPGGSENHFGLFTVDGQAKFAIWNLVDQGKFKGLSRDNNLVEKTHHGNVQNLLNSVELPPVKESDLQMHQ